MVNIPKSRNTYCRKCKMHTPHKVTQAGFGDQTKPENPKKAKTTDMIVWKFECTMCKAKRMKPIKRTKHFKRIMAREKGDKVKAQGMCPPTSPCLARLL